MQEKVLLVKIDKEPDVKVRIPNQEDKGRVITSKDGKKRTIYADKEQFPYKLYNDIKIKIVTTLREFSFSIAAGYVYDGASIPKFLHTLVGGNGEPKFLVPALLHDYMLEKMQDIYNNLKNQISVDDYRRITTNTFKWELQYYDSTRFKSWLMGGSVHIWQCTGSRKQWNDLRTLEAL